ncbi:hypothetical protein LCGC14_1878880 [marine sediment metagenome]|uniref:Uncharacterized protein n=1 Tax=marine sediment metagenome TaxID=412755 RepID=A0A0F9GQZ9_9ZZZZ
MAMTARSGAMSAVEFPTKVAEKLQGIVLRIQEKQRELSELEEQRQRYADALAVWEREETRAERARQRKARP